MNQLLQARMQAMSEVELYDALYRDQLTQVLNRRAFLAVGFRAVAVVDMDSLKWLNDTHGHRVGDQYLARLAATLVAEVGPNNVFRISGDEFAVTGDSPARIRRALERVRTVFPGMSYGADWNLTRADKALITDKARREQAGTRAGRGLPPPWMEQAA